MYVWVLKRNVSKDLGVYFSNHNMLKENTAFIIIIIIIIIIIMLIIVYVVVVVWAVIHCLIYSLLRPFMCFSTHQFAHKFNFGQLNHILCQYL